MVEAITTFITIIEYKFPKINSYHKPFATFGFKLGFKLCVAIHCVQSPRDTDDAIASALWTRNPW